MAQAILQIVRFVCSAMPFWEGESGTVFSYVIPLALQYQFPFGLVRVRVHCPPVVFLIFLPE